MTSSDSDDDDDDNSGCNNSASLEPIHLPLDDFTFQYEKEFRNPNMFGEIYSMAFASAAIFVLADIRAAARDGLIELSEDIQTLPVTSDAIVTAFRANEKRLKSVLRDEDFIFLKHVSASTDAIEDDTNDDEKLALIMLKQCTFEYFGDDHAESDCVYLILRNSFKKRITVCFRGSITLQDWIQDSKVFVQDIPNPVSDRPGQPPTIGVHLGFREYLYGESTKTSIREVGLIKSSVGSFAITANSDDGGSDTETSMDSWNIVDVVTALAKWKEQTGIIGSISKTYPTAVDTTRSDENTTLKEDTEQESQINENDDRSAKKCGESPCHSGHQCRLDKILEEVKNLVQKYNDHLVYITGHSLGGALGLLTALEAGTRFGKKGRPITFIGIANPRGGTEEFRDAVNVLEKEGKLRCVCVHAVHDLVPMIPVSTIATASKKRFCQCGIELVLSKGKFEIRYSSKPDDKYMHRVGKVLKSPHKIKQRHHYLTYLKEMKVFAEPLRKLHLNDYYNKLYSFEVFVSSEKKLTPMTVEVQKYGNENVSAYTYDLDAREEEAEDQDCNEEASI